jgi:acyl-CoA synthetase (NDP forming)
VLRATGIPTARWLDLGTPADVGPVAQELGFPLVAKVSSSRITHKSDVGGVRLRLRDMASVERAVGELLELARTKDPDATVVVQQMASGGTEVIFGAVADQKFGPILMFGLGGIYVEVLKDVAFRVHPVSDVDAAEMLDSIKGAQLLKGARGKAPVDRQALQETLLRLSQLLGEFPEILEFDMNPFMAASGRGKSVAVDGRFRLRP